MGTHRALTTSSILALLALFAASTTAQGNTPAFPSTSASLAPSSPSASSPAPTGSTHHSGGSNSYANYYFIFLALVAGIILVSTLFLFRRRRRARLRLHRVAGRERALQQDLARGGGGVPGGDPLAGFAARGRRYAGRRGGFSSGEVVLEEGLNEHGEAPPPYMPKPQEEEEEGDGRQRDAAGYEAGGPAVPLQTLARENVGLKPPDYVATHTQDVTPRLERPTTAASSASAGERAAGERGDVTH